MYVLGVVKSENRKEGRKKERKKEMKERKGRNELRIVIKREGK